MLDSDASYAILVAEVDLISSNCYLLYILYYELRNCKNMMMSAYSVW